MTVHAFNPYRLVTGIPCPNCDQDDDVELEHQPSRHYKEGILICPQCQYSENV